MKDLVKPFTRLLPELEIKNAQRELRKGDNDAKVGPEARALLESCAASANVVFEKATSAHVLDGAGPPSLETFRTYVQQTEDLMKEAITLPFHATFMKRMPDEEALADLRAIDVQLASLRDEAKRLARDCKSSSAQTDSLTDSQARDDARRELDQGA